jgi:hypothetical protein
LVELFLPDVNLLLELFISLKQFEGALEVLHRSRPQLPRTSWRT